MTTRCCQETFCAERDRTFRRVLWAYRTGDSNMQSVWLCSRNDVIGNLAVLLAALGVFGTGTGWPDVIVASIMCTLAIQGAWRVVRRSLAEFREAHA